MDVMYPGAWMLCILVHGYYVFRCMDVMYLGGCYVPWCMDVMYFGGWMLCILVHGCYVYPGGCYVPWCMDVIYPGAMLCTCILVDVMHSGGCCVFE